METNTFLDKTPTPSSLLGFRTAENFSRVGGEEFIWDQWIKSLCLLSSSDEKEISNKTNLRLERETKFSYTIHVTLCKDNLSTLICISFHDPPLPVSTTNPNQKRRKLGSRSLRVRHPG